ncbi:histone deacetylase [Phanerochaete sordida]|uniref:Histone deacetylase 8 n=1 Tax=Phanerochaete sordida TaxID=48140 RepID=A0A9P3LL97_9APHY|nr:histone deacetylase [Phanerochaete sordida]
MYHSNDYVDFITNLANSSSTAADKEETRRRHAEFGIEEDCPVFRGLPEYTRLVAGATLTAVKTLTEGQADVAICWDGGRHHAQKARASGFCYVADCVLALLALKRVRVPSPDGTPPRRARVLYLDLDLHFADGVAQAFLHANAGGAAPTLVTLSLHHAAPGVFPAVPLAALSDADAPGADACTVCVPLARGTGNAAFARVWRGVERVRAALRPDFVVLQCGADGLAGDPCALWNWALGGEGGLGWCVDRVCNAWGCKTLLLGGGGYNSPNVARAWTYLTSIALRQPLSLDSDIPDHNAFPLYAPSFTLDVPAGNAQDQNTEEYLQTVETRLDRVAEIIRQRMGE